MREKCGGGEKEMLANNIKKVRRLLMVVLRP